jgi:methionine sulfoxide reductase heme-binding subunit
MESIRPKLQGWNIVGYTALTILLIIILILSINGIDEQGMRIAIRATARSSCLLFICAFMASTLRKMRSNQLTQWFVKNRRYLGLSFAVSHGFHALAIIGLALLATEGTVRTNHGGNLGYFFIIAMAATSFPKTVDFIGDRAWKILHTVGMYYLWLAFTYSFIRRLLGGDSLVIYLPFTILLIAAIILRFVVPKLTKIDRSKLPQESYK